MFKDFGKRLQRDVKAIVDGRIAGSETRSGSLMKVSLGFLEGWGSVSGVRRQDVWQNKDLSGMAGSETLSSRRCVLCLHLLSLY